MSSSALEYALTTVDQGGYIKEPPPQRHAAPSAPWPWIDIDDDIDPEQLESPLPPIPPLCDHKDCGGCWQGYPQSRFPNWTLGQLQRSGVFKVIENEKESCTIYSVNVDTTGFFFNDGNVVVEEGNKQEFWNSIAFEMRPRNIRVRALFIHNLNGPTLQMLGAKYNIEPSFFSSSLSFIPSRSQQEVRPGKGDHITITVTFLRAVRSETGRSSLSLTSPAPLSSNSSSAIHTQAPLSIGSDHRMLVLDLLAVHLIRSNDELGSTIISYHDKNKNATSAPFLHERIRYAGPSVYWQSIFQKSTDPTFILLVFIWHCLYSWDSSLEKLLSQVSWMESQIMHSADTELMRDLHTLQSYLLYYPSLLEDFRSSIVFILNTPNPAMDLYPEEHDLSQLMLRKECYTLLTEVERLQRNCTMGEKRLDNVINLAGLEATRKYAEAAIRDSAIMKQIAYLGMTFLPASFIASIFGMNVKELNSAMGTLAQFFTAATLLTATTIWIIIALQSEHFFRTEPTISFWRRLAWPAFFLRHLFIGKKRHELETVLHRLNITQARQRRRNASPNVRLA
ncbi:hypothetical protein GYMLUDRAFT_71238 [Collybiopsis luxurians FD-317 M1]|nr:hypothetical protein GYMLUDRAFT_71238 [Collybiopsis luxurians FD-317 M1]